ncbi:MAG: FHA domain-containing protein [Micrococcales bacterium]|nr:FHA domain-containing protein [Micrococcales bacterium]
MSLQVADLAPVVAVRRFVDGTLVSGIFEQMLRTDGALKAYLSTKDAPPSVGGPLLTYLRELDWLQPKDVLEAQRVLVRLLIAVGEDVAPTDRYERRARLFDQQLMLWSRVQPTWLSIPATYFATLLEECEQMPEDSLEKAMKAKVRSLFRYRTRPPVWLHDETWPVNANGPLTFVEQIDISGPYDTSYRYVFRDETSHERYELAQSTARFEPTSSPLPASAAMGSAASLDPLVPASDDDEPVPMSVLEALAEALAGLDDELDGGLPTIDPGPQTDPIPTVQQPTQEMPSPVQPWVDPVALGADDPTKPVVPPPTRWGLELDDGRRVELWSSSIVLGREPQVSGSAVQGLTVTSDDPSTLLNTHARLDLIDGVWWVTNLSADGGVEVVGARGSHIAVPAGRSVPVRTHLGLGPVEAQIVPLPGLGPARPPLGAADPDPADPVDPDPVDESTEEPVKRSGLRARPTRRTASLPVAAKPSAEPQPTTDPWAPRPAPPLTARVPSDDDLEVTVETDPSAFERWTLSLGDGRAFVVRAPSVVVGRRPSVSAPGMQALAVADATRTLSRTHARLDLVEGVWRVTDLGSTNGVVVTDVDGKEATAAPGSPTPVYGYVAFGSVEARLVSGPSGLGGS